MKSLDVRQFCIDHWQVLSLYGIVLFIVLFTATFKLHSLLPGYNVAELQTYQASTSLKTILHHPVNAPYLILSWLVVKSHTTQPLFYLRIISATLGLCTLALFTWLLHHWHGNRVALIGTLLFGTSSWLLHITRLGTPAILLFGLFALVACGIWLQNTRSPYAIVALLILSAALMYVPGMPWIIGLIMVTNWKRLDDLFTKQLAVVMIGTIAAIGMLVPLGWAIYRTPAIGKTLLNLPSTSWPTPLAVLRHIAAVPFHIFVYGQGNPIFELGHLPVLSVFSSVMFVFGAYVYWRHFGLQRTKLLVLILIAGSIVIGLGGMTNVGLLVPFLYLVASTGVGYLFEQWFGVFPRNPLAQMSATVCVLALVLLVVTYNLRVYFITWPHADATQASFRLSDIGSPKTFDTIHR
jgi:hypothetical protein